MVEKAQQKCLIEFEFQRKSYSPPPELIIIKTSNKWWKTNLFCISCGKKEVIATEEIWEDNAGYQHVCLSCGWGFMGNDTPYLYDAYTEENFLKEARKVFYE